MSVKAGSFSPGATGDVVITGLTFLPTELVIRMGNATSADDTSVISRCDGWCTGANQSYDSFFHDSTGVKQGRGTDKTVRYMRRVSGTITDIVVGTFVSFDDNGGGNYGFTLNFTAVNANYQVRYIARG